MKSLNGILILGVTLLVAVSQAQVIVGDEGISPAQGKTTSPAFRVNGSDERGVISRVNPQTSLVISGYSGGDAAGMSSKEGFGAGVTMDLGHDDLVFEPGVLYRQMGSHVDGPFHRGTLSASYVSIPFAGKYYFNGQNGSSGYMKGGFLPSFLAGKEAKSEVLSAPLKSPDLSFFDLDFIVGLGGKIQVNDSANILIEVSYIRGITNVYADASQGSLYNSAVIFTAGVGFDTN